MLLLLLEQEEYLGLLPYSEKSDTLELASTHKTQKSQRAFLKWSTPENASLEDLRYPPKGHVGAECNPPKYGLPLYQMSPIGKGRPLAQSSGLNPPQWLQSGALPRWTVSSLSRLRNP